MIYTAPLEAYPAELDRFTLNSDSGSLGPAFISGNFGGGSIFPLADGTNVLTGAGTLLDTNLNLIRELGFGPVAIARAPERDLYALFAPGQVRFVRETSWETFLTLPAAADVVYAAKFENRLYEAGISKTNTYIRSRLIPAVTVDQNVPPVVRLLSPTNQVVVLGSTLTLTGEAEDLDGSVQTIAFYANDRLVYEGAYRFYQIPWQPTNSGTYSIVAVARDNLGATNASPVVSIIVNQPPVITLLDPSAAGPLLSPASFTAQAEASDADGQVVRVDFYYMRDYSHSQYLGSSFAPPFALQVKDLVGIGGYLRAVAVDNYGATAQKIVPLRLVGLSGDDSYRPYIAPQGPFAAHANNSQATRQQNEPAIVRYDAPATLWWNWTAPSNCVVFLNTVGSSFDTSLAVFTGTNLASLTLISENDDDPINPPSSLVKFDAVQGTTYDIVVGSTVPAEIGDVVLNLETEPLPAQITGPAPANDFRTNSIPLSGTNVIVTGSNVGATAETPEPWAAGLSPHKSVWWNWTAPAVGRLEVSTAGSDFDTVLGVIIGTVPGIGNDDGPGTLTSPALLRYHSRANVQFFRRWICRGLREHRAQSAARNRPPPHSSRQRFVDQQLQTVRERDPDKRLQ